MGNEKHQPSGFFALRTALLPFDTLTEWCQGAGNPTDEESYQKASSLLRERLLALVSRPEIREALFIASTSLDESISLWKENPESERGRKIERSISRYFLRMAARSTPFGLFAGGSVGKLARHTKIELAPLKEYRRHTRLDMYYLCALTEKLKTDPRLRDQLVYRPNSSLYYTAGRYRYAEARMENRNLSYFLVGVDPTDYLTETLQRAGQGAHIQDLAEPLVDGEISIEEAAGYIGELIESQILVPDLEPNVTGEEPIHGILKQLNEIPDARPIAENLEKIRKIIGKIDEKGLGNPPQAYHDVESALKDLPAEVVPAKLFQVDMFKPMKEASLGQGVLNEIQKGMELLYRLSPPPSGQTVLERFIQAFQSRYEDREVDLVEVLDNENGIGLEQGADLDQDVSPLLEGLPFPGGGESTPSWGSQARGNFLFRQIASAVRENRREWKLSKEDQAALSSEGQKPLPDTFHVMARIVAPSEEAIAKGNYRVYFEGASGPSGARMFGRFCHGDPRLLEATREHLEAEEACSPDAIFAEICYLPEGRVGNIQLRPVLRKYEIPYLGKSGAPLEDQIPVTDLAISIRSGRIVLRSRRLNRIIVPRMTTAHNYSMKSTVIYRFLCMLQGEGKTGGMGWSWGPFDEAPFLPRVTAGRLILRRASWTVLGEDLKPIGKKEGYKRFAAVQELRRERELPRFVLLADGDNELTVDLDNALSVDTFVDLVKNRGGIRLHEMVPGPEDLFVKGPEGNYVHELAIPFVKPSREEGAEAVARIPAENRRFPPGSEWLYFRVYGGHSSSDEVLREVIRPVVDQVIPSGAADNWFFLRYGDPDWHIRFRFHGEPGRLMSEVFPLVQQGLLPLIGENRVYKVQLDTYEREVERYGGGVGTELAEKFFHADSDAILSIVDSLSGDEGSDARWRLAVPGCDRILNDLGFDLKTKISILKGMKEGWAREFNVDSFFRKKLGEKYRREEEDLMTLLSPEVPQEHWLSPGIDLFRERSAKMIPITQALREAEEKGRLSSTLMEIAGSFLHMHNNRILASSQRAHEVVLYDFLFRAYQRMNAQQKGPKK